MRVLFLDCFSGISGDMTVGALCDLGVKPSTLEWELSKVEIGDFHMHFERKQRHAIEGIKFGIHEGATHTHAQDEEEGGHEEEGAHAHPPHEHPHSHGPDEHEHGPECHHGHSHEEEGHAHAHSHEPHGHSDDCCHGEHGHEHSHGHGHSHEEESGHEHGRSFAEIRALIEKSDLSDFVKLHAVSIFKRIAVAEGKIHGKTPEEVAFHEVGALDSIADIICVCVGIEQLGVERVLVSALEDGHGWVECAHGRYPIPAIATLEILHGIPIAQADEPFELITPTGAAILAEFGHSFGVMPRMRVEKIGYGIGSRQIPNRPNVLRAVLGTSEEAAATPAYQTDTITRIETNLDDLSPEITGNVLAKLLAAGALDVFLTPIQMKKNRPGVQLTVLTEEPALSKIADLLFSETTSFGIRMDRVERWKLDRKFQTVSTPFGEIIVKMGLRGGTVVQAAPEFESCLAASERTGQPLRVIYEAALRSYGAAPQSSRA